ncbi:nitrogen fixation protein NifZ [Bradyrhizobium sp. CIAT3101]|uniref:nitrogen fixation protein NifZ n=1 Tax=Bradyrhizobium sp. CIAT3101 TaxID=439387 RepID=UPI0024B2487F|nr:nitrogen fixation protein NifZ [Bradyrhizobium sp. CIAT3101]WFU80403.1 nitrogen fixation protein NifZ [Bradyrhizobium sp. CIAT3101]
MSSGVPNNDLVELTSAPAFDFGEKVRANRTIRNDGTYAGREIGDILAKKGEVGYVVSIGTFLQKFYIYGVEFIESGNRVGMKREELDRIATGGGRPAVAQELSTMIEAEPPEYQRGPAR